MTSYLAVAAVVGALIALHELGHFVAAKACGIPVERFSIGMGPKVFAVERGGTWYWLSAIPIGGYVLPGLAEPEFRKLPLGKQIVFALGGPAANLAAAYAGLLVLARFDVVLATTLFGSGLGELGRAVTALVSGQGELSGVVGIVATGGSMFGSTLKGLGEVPGITGRPATYIFRQLNDMKTGNRKGPWVELMKQVVEKLDDDDMIALAAYLGSLDP